MGRTEHYLHASAYVCETVWSCMVWPVRRVVGCIAVVCACGVHVCSLLCKMCKMVVVMRFYVNIN